MKIDPHYSNVTVMSAVSMAAATPKSDYILGDKTRETIASSAARSIVNLIDIATADGVSPREVCEAIVREARLRSLKNMEDNCEQRAN